MQIQKINNNVTFGYDKKLNTKLIKKLDKENPDDIVAVTIRNLNTFCNNTEDLMNICSESEEELLFKTFVPAKIALSSLVEYKYHSLNFTNKEIDGYLADGTKALKKDLDGGAPWQFSVAEELTESVNMANAEDLTPEQRAKMEEAEQKQIAGINFVKKENIDIIEQYKPNEFSPEGFDSLGGMDELKEELIDKIIYPVTHPQEAKLDFAEYGKRPPRGVMLYGPPGCGKTSITEALSQEAGLPLFKLKISKAGSPYINQTAANYQKAFDYVAECAQTIGQPCFMFIDEIDGLTKGRDKDSSSEDLKQMGTLLNLIETARDRNIYVIGATNKYDIIDEAIKRRFDEQVYIGMPDIETREKVLYKTLAQRLKGIPLAEEPDDLHEIALKLNGYPTSAIIIISDKAAAIARKDGRRIITKEDFFTEIEKNKNLKIRERDYKSDKNKTSIGYKQD